MGHNHGHTLEESNTENIRTAFFLNIFFTLVEIIGGFLTNSVAILADALHDLGDSLSLGLAWYFQKISNRKSNKKYTYGYKRYTIVGALVNAIVLLTGTIVMLYEIIPRLFHPEVSNAKGMIALAVLGILVNGAAVFKLKKGSTINERVVMLHLLEDVLGWIAVLIGAIIMYFFDWPIIDPILSAAIAVYILINVFKNLKSVMHVLLQGVPENVNHNEVELILNKNENILSFHDLHIWSLDGNYNILSIHIVVSNNQDPSNFPELKSELRHELEHHNIHHATIEVDIEGELCEFDNEDAI